MNTTLILPSPDTVQVHWIWFQILLTLTFVLHLILMNLLLGGSLLAVWDLIKKKTFDSDYKKLPILVALTVNLGVPPLLFVQVLFGHLFYSSSVMMAVYWILVIPVLILAYLGAHVFSVKMSTNPRLAKASVAVSALLILYIAFMFVNNSTLAIQPQKWSEYLTNPGGTILNVADLSFWPRFLHFIIAAVAVASLGRAVWAKLTGIKAGKKNKQNNDKDAFIKNNLRVFGWATMVQFVIGSFFFFSMPSGTIKTFMGGNIIATILFALVYISAALIVYFAMKGKLLHSVIQVIFQVIIMAIVREITRSSYLAGVFSPSDLKSVSQYSPFIAFVLIFLAGLWLLYFMLKQIKNNKAKRS